jgi:hypothetical protein|tara:strand:- start:452 stop:571 length:120 start_codon:yes stop_codon:yes gene_type:complete
MKKFQEQKVFIMNEQQIFTWDDTVIDPPTSNWKLSGFTF